MPISVAATSCPRPIPDAPPVTIANPPLSSESATLLSSLSFVFIGCLTHRKPSGARPCAVRAELQREPEPEPHAETER